MISLDKAVGKIVDKSPNFMRGISGLVTDVIPGDGMIKDDDAGHEHYLMTGKSAFDLIQKSLKSNKIQTESIKRVLDFACGYGRVLRWLQAGFRGAEIDAVDADVKAVGEVAKVFRVRAQAISKDWSNLSGSNYDLIWVGSLFTHISEYRTNDLLAILEDRLRPGGLLAATLHGELVVGRLRSGERDYGLEPSGIAAVLGGYDTDGYGFSGYPNVPDYGISATTKEKLEETLSVTGLSNIEHIPAGWAKHQDYFSCVKGA